MVSLPISVSNSRGQVRSCAEAVTARRNKHMAAMRAVRRFIKTYSVLDLELQEWWREDHDADFESSAIRATVERLRVGERPHDVWVRFPARPDSVIRLVLRLARSAKHLAHDR